MTPSDEVWLVIDSPFNRAWAKSIIGKTFPLDKAPSYAAVKQVKVTPDETSKES